MSGIRQPTLVRRATALLGRTFGYPSFIRIVDFWYDEQYAGGSLREFIERIGRENLPKRAIYTQIRRREKELARWIWDLRKRAEVKVLVDLSEQKAGR